MHLKVSLPWWQAYFFRVRGGGGAAPLDNGERASLHLKGSSSLAVFGIKYHKLLIYLTLMGFIHHFTPKLTYLMGQQSDFDDWTTARFGPK